MFIQLKRLSLQNGQTGETLFLVEFSEDMDEKDGNQLNTIYRLEGVGMKISIIRSLCHNTKIDNNTKIS